MIHADQAFESAKVELNEQGITRCCCDANSTVPFIERGIMFGKEIVRYVWSMLLKKRKQILTQLMRELVVSTMKMISSIRRRGRLHSVMSLGQIVLDRKLVLPFYPQETFVYTFTGGTTNCITNISTVDKLYLRPNDEGGRYFVYYISTMQRSSACRVIGINKKPILMTNLITDLINKQTREEKQGIKFSGINKNTTVNDYKEQVSDSNMIAHTVSPPKSVCLQCST